VQRVLDRYVPAFAGLRIRVPLMLNDGIPVCEMGSIDNVSPSEPPASVMVNLKLVTPSRAVNAVLRSATRSGGLRRRSRLAGDGRGGGASGSSGRGEPPPHAEREMAAATVRIAGHGCVAEQPETRRPPLGPWATAGGEAPGRHRDQGITTPLNSPNQAAPTCAGPRHARRRARPYGRGPP